LQNIEKPLEAVLSGVKQPGDFFVCGAMEIPMPKVEVDGAGTLSFPVPDAQIDALVRVAQRAPYGRGEETIVVSAELYKLLVYDRGGFLPRITVLRS
jgi:hypothetical protein